MWLFKSISENENIAGVLNPFSAVLMFCSLWIASEGWWLLLQFGWAVCKTAPAPLQLLCLLLILSSSGKRGHWSFAQLMSRPFSEAASWALQQESCEEAVARILAKPVSFVGAQRWGGIGFASDLCIATWVCRSSCNSAEGTCSWLGMQLLSKVHVCGYPGGNLVLTLGTTEPWKCDLQAPSSLLSPRLYVLVCGFFFSFPSQHGNSGICMAALVPEGN